MSDQEDKYVSRNSAEGGYTIGDLNPMYPSQRPELLDTQFKTTEAHLKKNISNYLSPSLLSRNKGALRGVVVHSDMPTTPENEYDWSRIATGDPGSTLPGYRVYVPEFNQWLKPPKDFKNCSPEFIKMCTKFIATSNAAVDNPRPGDLVWVDYMDRENYTEPVYLGKINNEPNIKIIINNESDPRTSPSINPPLNAADIPLPGQYNTLSSEQYNSKLSQNFTLGQLTLTNKKNLDNTPSPNQIENLKYLCTEVLEPIYEKYGMPIITSGFRSQEVNNAVNGSSNSQHMTGQAADIRFSGKSHYDIAMWIWMESGINFDQMILENNIDGSPDSGWIHISFSIDNNSKEVLSADTKLPENIRYVNYLKKRSRDRARWI